MFDIEYKGANTVVISTKKISLITDPKHSIFGEKDLVLKDGVELATEDRFATRNDNFKLSISYPGSYEVSDFTINGFQEQRHIDEEKDGKKSVIYLPIGGGGYTLDATSAANIARRSDAKVIIPIHYSDDGIKYAVSQSDFSLFEKELGVEVETTVKYKVKSIASLPEKMTLVKIERSK